MADSKKTVVVKVTSTGLKETITDLKELNKETGKKDRKVKISVDKTYFKKSVSDVLATLTTGGSRSLKVRASIDKALFKNSIMSQIRQIEKRGIRFSTQVIERDTKKEYSQSASDQLSRAGIIAIAKGQSETSQGDYRRNQGLTGASGASGRDFGKMASGMGGFVALYADYAAKVFALGAAFRGLRESANLDQMIKGMKEYGKTTGMSLGIVAKQLQTATDMAVTYKEAADTATLAAAAGFGSEDILKMGKAAKVAALALGRNVPDALDRMTRGVVKAEPELLDELGIILRLKDAQEQWAESNNKSVSSMTTFEKQMAVMEFATGQALTKFGHLKDTMDPNRWDVISSKVTDMALNIGASFNNYLAPALDIVAKSPVAMITSFGLLVSYLGSKVLPSIGNLSEEWKTKAESMSIDADKLEDSILASRRAGFVSKAGARKLYGKAIAESAKGSVLKDYYSELSQGAKPFKAFIRGVKNINYQMSTLHSTQIHGISLWNKWATVMSTSVTLAIRSVTTALTGLVKVALKVASVVGIVQIAIDALLKFTGISTKNASEVDSAHNNLSNTFEEATQKYKNYIRILNTSDGSLQSMADLSSHTSNRISNMATSFRDFTDEQSIFIDNSSETDRTINELWGTLGSSVLEDSQKNLETLGSTLHTLKLSWEDLNTSQEEVEKVTKSGSATLEDLRNVLVKVSEGLEKSAKSSKLLAGNFKGAVESLKQFNKEYKTFEESFKSPSIFDGMISAIEEYNRSLPAIQIIDPDTLSGLAKTFEHANAQYESLITIAKKLNAETVDPSYKAQVFLAATTDQDLTKVNDLLNKQKDLNLKELIDSRARELSSRKRAAQAQEEAKHLKEIGLLNEAAVKHNKAITLSIQHHNEMLKGRVKALELEEAKGENVQDTDRIRKLKAAILGLETKIYNLRKSTLSVRVEDLKILTKLQNEELDHNNTLLGLKEQLFNINSNSNLDIVRSISLDKLSNSYQKERNSLYSTYVERLDKEQGDTTYITEEYNRQLVYLKEKNKLQTKLLDIQHQIAEDERRQAINARKMEYIDDALSKREELRDRIESLIEIQATATNDQISLDNRLQQQQLARLQDTYNVEVQRVKLSEKTKKEKKDELTRLASILKMDKAILEEEQKINKVLAARDKFYDAQEDTSSARLSYLLAARDANISIFREEELAAARQAKFGAAEQKRERIRRTLRLEMSKLAEKSLDYQARALELKELEYQKAQELIELQTDFYEDEQEAHERRMKNGKEYGRTIRDEWLYTIKEMEDSMQSFSEFMVQMSVDSFKSVSQQAMDNWKEAGSVWGTNMWNSIWDSMGDSLIEQGQELMVLGQSQLMAGFAGASGPTKEQEARFEAERVRAMEEKKLASVKDNTVTLSESVNAMLLQVKELKALNAQKIGDSITSLKETIGDKLVNQLSGLTLALQNFWHNQSGQKNAQTSSPGETGSPAVRNPRAGTGDVHSKAAWHARNKATGGSIRGPGDDRIPPMSTMPSNGGGAVSEAQHNSDSSYLSVTKKVVEQQDKAVEQQGKAVEKHKSTIDNFGNVYYDKYDNLFRLKFTNEVALVEEQKKQKVAERDNLGKTYQINNSKLGQTLNEWGMNAEGIFNVGAGALSKSIGMALKTGSLDLKNVLSSFTLAIGNAFINAAANQAGEWLMSSLFFANGGVAEGGFRAFAKGGLVNKPTLGLVGEGKYNEAVVPLPDGKSIPVIQNSPLKDSGGDTTNNVTVTINMETGTANKNASGEGGKGGFDLGKLGDQVASQVQQVLQDEKRPGGILSEI